MDDRTRDLLEQGWPRFSSGEFGRRRRALLDAAASRGADLVVVYGANRSGSAVPWLCGWPVSREAVLIVDSRSGEDLLFVQFHNHVPQATELAECRVRWGGPSTVDTVEDELSSRGVGERTIGVVGPVPPGLHGRLVDLAAGTVGLGREYTRLRMTKSDEELDWLRVGAHLSDLGVAALRDGLRPGMTDHRLADLIERAYVPLGGTTHIHYMAITPMADPARGVPAQITTGRVLGPDDVLATEISASFHGYTGQVLRTMTPAAELLSPFDELHDVAAAAFDAVCAALVPGATAESVVDASRVIEEAGFTTIDDLVHGYGGGYLPPVLGSRSRPAGPIPDIVIEEGMTVVVQPNVTTTDGRAGVQTGELVHVTAEGARSLHASPPGPWLSAGAG